MQLKFKKAEVVTATNAEQMGLSITAMLSLGMDWRLYGPTECIVNTDGSLHYWQTFLLYEPVLEEAKPSDGEQVQ